MQHAVDSVEGHHVTGFPLLSRIYRLRAAFAEKFSALTAEAQPQAELLQDRRDVDSQRPERIGVEPVGLSLGGAEEVSDRGSTQPVEES